ncbi:hypothetical protein [Lutispora sp.]|nr:hypothetical protein [Lutispora sp.]
MYNDKNVYMPMTITINEARCPQNHPCPSVKVCPAGALIDFEEVIS